jgi:hypothetical protein
VGGGDIPGDFNARVGNKGQLAQQQIHPQLFQIAVKVVAVHQVEGSLQQRGPAAASGHRRLDASIAAAAGGGRVGTAAVAAGGDKRAPVDGGRGVILAAGGGGDGLPAGRRAQAVATHQVGQLARGGGVGEAASHVQKKDYCQAM